MRLSNRASDLRRVLPFKVQNSHRSPVFREKLCSGQSNPLFRRCARNDSDSIL
jgi:hypothetical protein